jgi:hypothetical protein
MRIFISSLMSGFEQYRNAARRAVTTLRNEAVMAEDFGAKPNSSQIACLQGVRSADVVVLILGSDYGFVPAGSAISATHQEYREARETKPIMAFVQQGIDPSPEQKVFIDEVQAWERGLFRSEFTNADDLNSAITRALYDYALNIAVGPVDQEQLVLNAAALISPGKQTDSSSTLLKIAIVGGPIQRILRPMQMEDVALGEHFQQSALFGENRLFDRTKGSIVKLDGADLVVAQERGASIRLTEQGALVFRLSPEDTVSGDRMGFGSMVVIEEIVKERLGAALGFAAGVIERIDPTQRLTHLGVAAHILGGEYLTWRTRAQQLASNGSMQMNIGRNERQPVAIPIRRAAIRLDRTPLVEDLIVPLRRQFSTG